MKYLLAVCTCPVVLFRVLIIKKYLLEKLGFIFVERVTESVVSTLVFKLIRIDVVVNNVKIRN